MILQIPSTDAPVGSPSYDGGSAYAVRVVSFSSGATIAFDAQKSSRKVLGYFAYRTRRPGGWTRIYLTGTVTIEVATDPLEAFDGSGAAGVSSVDASGNTIVVGRGSLVMKSFSVQGVTVAGTAIWIPAAGKKFRLLGWALVGSVAEDISLKDGAAVFAVIPSAAGGPAQPVNLGLDGYLSTAVNNQLVVSAAVENVSGTVWGVEE